MGQRYYRILIFVVLLLALVIWIDWPGNTGIHIGSFNRAVDTRLGLDLRGGMRVLMEVDLPADVPVTAQALQDAKQILANRSNALGVSEVTFQTSGTRRIVGEFPGVTNTEEVIAALKQVGQLAFVPLGQTSLPIGTIVQLDYSSAPQTGTAATQAAGETPVSPTATVTTAPTVEPTTAAAADGTTPAATPEAAPTVYPVLMTGSQLQDVGVTRNTLGQYVISFVLKSDASKLFADFTSTHVGDTLAIVLDNKVISAPTINSAITEGSGIIEGNFTYDSANALAIQLRYGSLPVPLKVLETHAVGATLGQDSINKSVRAGAIGLILVILMMGILYRLPGVLADLALLMYALTSLALFKLIPVTLTLPGIAGFVLSIGVAVDANILIFERLKEELHEGRTLHQAIDLAWKRAWPSIRDSNFSTLITCIILFWFGSQFGATIVAGFAVTLALGVLVSLFTAIVVTRTFLHVVLDNLKFTEHPKWFGA